MGLLRILVFAACWSVYCCRAQEQITGPPASLITQIDFYTVTGGVVIVKGQVGDHPDTLNFVLDTGSGGISLDSALVSQLGLTPEKSDVRIRGLGGSRTVDFVRNTTLHFPGLAVDSLDFHINDYGFLSMVYGLTIDGVIGYSFFSRFIIQIDYDTNLIDVYSQGPFKYPRGGTMLRPSLNRLPSHPVFLKEQHKLFPRLLHDVGAGVCLMLSRDFAEDSLVFRHHKKFRKKEGHGLGGKIDMDITTVKEVKIGPYRFRHVPTLLFDDEYGITSYPYLGGLIGNDILRRFNVIYNYANRQIYLKPNSHFKEKFDYAYSGLDLLYVDGETLIGDVVRGSNAEKAGLLEGDIIIGVDGHLNASFFEFKKLLQAPKRRLDVIVSRDGELFAVKLKIESIK